MAAQLICNQWVAGSTPVTSSKKKSCDIPSKRWRVSWGFCFCMRCKMARKCDRFEEVMMVKRTHGEKRHTSRGMGLARRKQKPCKRSVLRKSCTFIEIFFRNRLTKSRRDGKIYRQSAVAVKIESGRVPEWPMGTDCKSAAFQLRWFESTRAHQEVQHPNRVLDLLFCRNFFRAERVNSNSIGPPYSPAGKKAPVGLF